MRWLRCLLVRLRACPSVQSFIGVSCPVGQQKKGQSGLYTRRVRSRSPVRARPNQKSRGGIKFPLGCGLRTAPGETYGCVFMALDTRPAEGLLASSTTLNAL